MFTKFYAKYPRQEDEEGARTAWNKLAPDSELQKVILAALDAQIGCDQWTRDAGQFIPLARNWLNFKRWKDKKHAQRTQRQRGTSSEFDPQLAERYYGVAGGG